MKIYSPLITGSISVNNVNVTNVTNVAGFATTSSVNTLIVRTGSYATTGSNQFNGNQSISGSITSNGTITAQTLVVQTVTSSVDFVTGSSVNGSLSSNTHQFTGSVLITGSVGIGINSPSATLHTEVSSSTWVSKIINTNTSSNNAGLLIKAGVNSGNEILLAQKANGTSVFLVDASGNVGIGTTSPGLNLAVQGLYGLPATSGVQGTGIFRVQDSASNIALDMGVIQNAGTWMQSGNKANSAVLPLSLNQNGGNVLIGTTTNGAYKLDINGTTRVSGVLTLSSTISNGTYTYTLPGATGTLALTSALSSYLATSGGTMTGGISIQATSATTSSRIQIVGNGVSTLIIGQNSRGGVVRGQGGSDELSFWTGGTGEEAAGGGGTERMRISGNGSVGAGGSTTNIYNASDIRLKKNITPITLGLNAIAALNPVKFNWADGFDEVEVDKIILGFIAQEVQEVLPEAVEAFSGETKLNDTIITDALRVNEKFIIPVLVKAIQELKAEIDTLKQQQ